MQNSVVERRLYFNTDKLRFGALHNSRTTVNIETQTNAFQVNAHLQSLQLWDRSSSHHSRKQPWEINIRLNPKQASRWNKGRNSPVNIWSIIKHLLPSLKQGITVLRQVDRHFEPVQCQCNWSERRRTSGLEPGMRQSLALSRNARGKKKSSQPRSQGLSSPHLKGSGDSEGTNETERDERGKKNRSLWGRWGDERTWERGCFLLSPRVSRASCATYGDVKRQKFQIRNCFTFLWNKHLKQAKQLNLA